MKDATEIVVILDRSGSMGVLAKDTIGTFNAFLSEQRARPGEVNMTLVLFNTVYSAEYISRPIAKVPALDETVYIPGGFTALLDAVGRGIDSLGEVLSRRPEAERPDKVIFVIITDGLENSSREYTHGQVKEKIQHQQEVYKWQFLFLGANIDAPTVAESIGITSSHAATYSSTKTGVHSVGSTVRKAVDSYVQDGTICQDWSSEIK